MKTQYIITKGSVPYAFGDSPKQAIDALIKNHLSQGLYSREGVVSSDEYTVTVDFPELNNQKSEVFEIFKVSQS